MLGGAREGYSTTQSDRWYWNALVETKSRFRDYETKTDRIFPVFALERT